MMKLTRVQTTLLAWAMLISGIACCARAQVPMTGAGKGAPTAAGCSFPSVSGLLGRWRADTGVTTSSGNVTAVADQSGNGNNLSNSGTVPFNATSAYNSKPAFDFVAANNAALIKSSFPMGTGAAGSVFLVGQMSSSTANFGGAAVYGNGANNDYDNTGSAAFITRQALMAGVETTLNSSAVDTAVSTGTNFRFVGTLNTHDIKQFVNGSAGGSLSIGATLAWTNNGTFVVGNRYLGSVGGGAWQGPLVEIAAGNGDWSANQGDLDTYAVCQYGA